MEYRRGDVRDPAALREAFAGADVVVHLAFLITGNASRATTRAINVDGTLNVFRAAAAAGASRFVYASSVAAYGWHADNPDLITEDWPVRPAGPAVLRAGEGRARGAARQAEAAGAPGPGAVPAAAAGGARPRTRSAARTCCPGRSRRWAGALFGRPRRLPVPVPVVVPEFPLQFVHEDDVGQALLLCVVGAGPPGAYNIAGDGVLTAADVAREFGALPLPVPAGAGAAGRAGGVPAAVPAAGRRVGRGRHPPVAHGHRPGQAGAGLAAPLHRPGGPARHPRGARPMSFNLATILRESALAHPDKPMLTSAR